MLLISVQSLQSAWPCSAFLSFLWGRYPHACLLLCVFMGWSPLVQLVHMGAELRELRSTADSTRTHRKTLQNFAPQNANVRAFYFVESHVTSLIITDLIKLSTTARLKIERHFVTGGVSLNLFQL